MPRVNVTVNFTVDIPDGFDPDEITFEPDIDHVAFAMMLNSRTPVSDCEDASVIGWETVSVEPVQE